MMSSGNAKSFILWINSNSFVNGCLYCLPTLVCALSFKGLRTNFIQMPHSKNWSKFGKCSEMFACLLGVHRLAVFCAADGWWRGAGRGDGGGLGQRRSGHRAPHSCQQSPEPADQPNTSILRLHTRDCVSFPCLTEKRHLLVNRFFLIMSSMCHVRSIVFFWIFWIFFFDAFVNVLQIETRA